MNVVISNRNHAIIDKLDVDIIKRVDGEYDLKDLLGKCVNLYFNKMIIDITAIINYTDYNVIKNLATAVDPNRVILLLPDEPAVNDQYYISNLVQCGFYNFTRNIEGIKFLYDHPNTLDQVQNLIVTQKKVEPKIVQTPIVTEPNQSVTERMNNQQQYVDASYKSLSKTMIIGIQNLSIHAGSTSLTHMLVRQANNHDIKAYGIEMFKQDFLFFHEDDILFSCMNKQDLENQLRKLQDGKVIFIDLNEFGECRNYCDNILYLVEPSYMRLTKMIKKDRNILATHKHDNIVLNMSFVNEKELADFEYESKIKVYYNLPPLNDREKNIPILDELLKKMGCQ